MWEMTSCMGGVVVVVFLRDIVGGVFFCGGVRCGHEVKSGGVMYEVSKSVRPGFYCSEG